MKKILLDTNAYSNFLRGDQQVLDILSEADIVYMSIFVLAELYVSFKGGNKELWNNNNLQIFLKKPTVQILNASMETSEIFAFIMNKLRKSGNPIPINDIWIAAHTFETGSLLISYDVHFNNISGLRLWNYSK